MKTRIVFLCALVSTAMIDMQTVDAATITVMNTNDSGPGSLRQALLDAHDHDRIEFVVTGTIKLTSDGLHIDKSVTIAGPGAHQLAVESNVRPRRASVFEVRPNVSVIISGLTITKGIATYGGGILNDHSILMVNNCIVTGNRATSGGGIYSDGDLGRADMVVENSTISSNAVTVAGGGIYIRSRGAPGNFAELNYSTVSGNSAEGFGGGIYITSTAQQGSAAERLFVRSSTISGNSVSVNSGGGLCSISHNAGQTLMHISNSTFSGNSARGYGGGIFSTFESPVGPADELWVSNSTFSGNSSILRPIGGTIDIRGALLISNTILRAAADGSIAYSFGSRSFGCNLSNDHDIHLLTAPGDRIGIDPALGPLQDNGGPTYTHALLAGSPAIDAGCGPTNFFEWPDNDQRGPGYPRVVNGRDDIGAFEVQTPTPSPTPTP